MKIARLNTTTWHCWLLYVFVTQISSPVLSTKPSKLVRLSTCAKMVSIISLGSIKPNLVHDIHFPTQSSICNHSKYLRENCVVDIIMLLCVQLYHFNLSPSGCAPWLRLKSAIQIADSHWEIFILLIAKRSSSKNRIMRKTYCSHPMKKDEEEIRKGYNEICLPNSLRAGS